MIHMRVIAQRLGRVGIATILLVAFAGEYRPVRAEIYEWTDDSGARHFDTSLQRVPEERRDEARVVVGAVTPGSVAAPADAGAPNPPSNADQNAHDDAFASGWDAGFRAGWESGYRASAENQPECAAQPGVVVMESRPPVVVNVPSYDPSGLYYRPPYNGVVTMPFDDGGSFGLTSRNQIQAQRALERGW